MWKIYSLFICILCWNRLSVNGDIFYDIRIDHNQIDQMKDIVITNCRPRFSWKLTNSIEERNIYQIGYQIEINSLKDQWNTERILSNDSIDVSLPKSIHLQSSTFYQFRLTIWTSQTCQSSEWIDFRTSIFDIDSLIKNKRDELMWIGSNQIQMNQLRKEFFISNKSSIESAICYISGIGYYHLFVNGHLIDPTRKLDPGLTLYEKRTFILSFQLTSFLNIGENVIGVELGNGWFSQEQYTQEGIQQHHYGPPRMLFLLDILFKNGDEMHIYSDRSWMGRQNEILHDSIYNGEFVDARQQRFNWSNVGFNDSFSLWISSEEMTSPLNESIHGQIVFQEMNPIRIGNSSLHINVDLSLKESLLSFNDIPPIIGRSFHQNGTFKPIKTWSPTIGVQIFDLGQNIAGWCRFKFIGDKGVAIYIKHGEILSPPSLTTNRSSDEISIDNLLGATQSDTYVLRGDTNGEFYEPKFTYHGFRYVSVFNSPNSMSVDDVQCSVLHSETTLKGHFVSSNSVINQIQHNIQWSQLNNLMSIPTDCPQREERRGWLADAGLTVNEALFNFDLIQFYVNYVNSIVDSQGDDGSVPDTVPFTDGDYPADPNWGSAFVRIVWQLYRHSNDQNILLKFYSNLQKYVQSLLNAHQSTGLANLFYSYGDWCPPSPQRRTNESLTSSFALLHDISILMNISQILHYENEIKFYSNIYEELSEEFHEVFYNVSSELYADGMQTPQILSLALPNVVPMNIRERILTHLVNDIVDRGFHLTTGIVGTSEVYPLLSDNGYHDIAMQLMTSVSYPSYGYMFNNEYENSTTLWELWDAPFQGPQMNSRNHIMFGSVGQWFYSHLAGFNLQSNLILIRPKMISEDLKDLLLSIDCQLDTQYGLLRLSYTRDQIPNSIIIRVTIPVNIQAKLIFEPLFVGAKCLKLIEGNEMIWSKNLNISFKDYPIEIDPISDLVSVEINSGRYQYQIYWE